MNRITTLKRAIQTLWIELPALVGEGWPQFERELNSYLEQLESATSDEQVERIYYDIRLLFFDQEQADARLIEVLNLDTDEDIIFRNVVSSKRIIVGDKNTSVLEPAPSSILLGVSAPSKVQPGEEFTVRFVAYLQEFESQVDRILRGLSPRSKPHLGMGWCRWQEGVRVTVILSCQYLDIAEPRQEIEWHSPYQVIPFDVVVQKTAPETTVVLKLDVYILDIRVAALRLDLNIRRICRGRARVSSKPRKYKRAKATPATTAFASYASQDRLRVLDRVEALRISAGMDIFQDCLSLHPGEPWKIKLLQEILDRDLFLLFWSKFAKDSQWVEWEWTTALVRRGEEAIQLHPLDIVNEAPPPPELAHLHFESPVMRIRKSYESTTTKTNP